MNKFNIFFLICLFLAIYCCKSTIKQSTWKGIESAIFVTSDIEDKTGFNQCGIGEAIIIKGDSLCFRDTCLFNSTINGMIGPYVTVKRSFIDDYDFSGRLTNFINTNRDDFNVSMVYFKSNDLNDSLCLIRVGEDTICLIYQPYAIKFVNK